MKSAPVIGISAGCGLLLASALTVNASVQSAAKRLKTGVAESEKPKVATAGDAEAAYCTPAFKSVLQRVLNACGLVGGGEGARRGCQPAEIKDIASISDADFNALFTPLKERGAIILFDDGKFELDDGGKAKVEELWQDRRGARYFFVVARASKTGTPQFNRSLSNKRANSIFLHVQDKFQEKDLDKKIGMLWLGNEYAQLGQEYCQWTNSRAGKPCASEAINRSAFVSWVDCQL